MNNTDTYLPVDRARTAIQREVLFTHLSVPGVWYTLGELETITGFPQASISARLRDFRKKKYGGHTVLRRRLGEGRGTWEYQLVLA
jgi:hypothetical protein